MDTLEVLTLLLVVFAALIYIDNRCNPLINLTLYKFPIVQPLDTPISFGFLI